MELKTKYQYTYFLHPFMVKENRYLKYIQKLLKNPNCKSQHGRNSNYA